MSKAGEKPARTKVKVVWNAHRAANPFLQFSNMGEGRCP